MAMRDLKGKIVFITGAASGIGAATALAFANQGCELILADIDKDGLATTKKSIAQTGSKVHTVELDVTDENRFAQVAEDLRSTVGVPHIVVNNAGIAVIGSFLNTPMDAVRRIMEINLYGVYNGCHAFLPMMLEAEGDRHLVNVASAASISPMPNMSAYAASKYAVDGLTEVLSIELNDSNVDVTCVHPGVINTPITQGKSYNGDAWQDRIRRLSEYYETKGSEPSVVADGIVKAVTTGCTHLFVGAQASSAEAFRRLSPAFLRKMTIKNARKIGFL